MSRAWVPVAVGLFCVGFFVLRFPDHPWGRPASMVSTVLIALPSVLALVRWQGPRRAAGAVVALAAYAYAVEIVGLITGLPYGSFEYGVGLGPKFLGLVPLSLPLTYVPLVLGAAGMLLTRTRPLSAAWVGVGALLLVAFDLVLDPGAVAMGYWTYAADGAYHGVPAVNFVGWCVTGAGAMVVLGVALRGGAEGRTARVAAGLVTSTLLAMSFWTGIGFWFGMLLPFVTGVAVCLVLAAPFLVRRDEDATVRVA